MEQEGASLQSWRGRIGNCKRRDARRHGLEWGRWTGDAGPVDGRCKNIISNGMSMTTLYDPPLTHHGKNIISNGMSMTTLYDPPL